VVGCWAEGLANQQKNRKGTRIQGLGFGTREKSATPAGETAKQTEEEEKKRNGDSENKKGEKKTIFCVEKYLVE
jgi:hypothetical protein